MFVVDSVAFQREVKDVAEFLYQVLVDGTVLRNAPALLIACNKQGTLPCALPYLSWAGMAAPAGQACLLCLLNSAAGLAAKGRAGVEVQTWAAQQSLCRSAWESCSSLAGWKGGRWALCGFCSLLWAELLLSVQAAGDGISWSTMNRP